ncbi:MAG: hypothetical protein KY475_12065 [Planctomycetes bacterium]|nr:hypothetical protein [Planctomycetota bacterium]
MPVRFRCEHCQQRLSVGSKKAGAVVSCPQCKNKVTVPAEEPSAQPPAPAEAFSAAPPTDAGPSTAVGEEPATPDEDYPEFPDYEYETEYVYVEEDEAPSTRQPLDLDKVAVPRWILYAQGALLGLVALVSFAFGVVIGGAAPESENADAGGPWSVAGSVAYDAGDNLPTPDSGATVILLPEDARPEAKAPTAPFRPDGEPLDPADPALAAIQQIGGDAAKADAEGQFRMSVPRSGAYFVLIVSAHLDRSGERPAPQHLAELGRYFQSAPELLGDSRYVWTRRRIDENEEISHVFR